MDLRLPSNMIDKPIGSDDGFASYAKRLGLLLLTVMVVAVLLLLSSQFVGL
jgi:hypothetical protein